MNKTISQKEGRVPKMPATEAMQQTTTSRHDKKTRKRRNNNDAVEKHVCSKVRGSCPEFAKISNPLYDPQKCSDMFNLLT